MEQQATTDLPGDTYEMVASVSDVAWRRRSWTIHGVGGPFEARRIGRRPSGLRHRLPVEIVGPAGTVAKIVRSRGLKGSAAQFVVMTPSDRVVGAFDAGHQFFGPGDPWLVSAEGERLGRIDPETRASYVDGVDELSGLRLTLGLTEVATLMWKTRAEPTTWRVAGVRSLSDDLRLLVVAHVLVIEPWRSGENAAARRSAYTSRRLL